MTRARPFYCGYYIGEAQYTSHSHNMAAAGSDGFYPAVKLSELRASGKTRVTIQERVIALFYVNGTVRALGSFLLS